MKENPADSERLSLKKMVEYIINPLFEDILISVLLSRFLLENQGDDSNTSLALQALKTHRPDLALSLRQFLVEELERRKNPH
jgi:hypothetical protein